uniref:Protein DETOXIFICATION n=1 Tax=Auxenochlorella protothecoides TaxID=3075 RepID=A0A1D1ZSA5_AUXPR
MHVASCRPCVPTPGPSSRSCLHPSAPRRVVRARAGARPTRVDADLPALETKRDMNGTGPGVHDAHKNGGDPEAPLAGTGHGPTRPPTPSSRPSLPGWLLNPNDPAILELTLPALLTLVADPMLSMATSVFVGQTGPTPLAALGINTSLFALCFSLFNFLATATTPLVATALQAGNGEQAGRTVLQGLALAVVLGLGLALALTAGSDAALGVMGVAPEAGDLFLQSRDYLTVRALAAPAVLLESVAQGALYGMRDMRTPLYVTAGANALNLGLGWLLVLHLGWGVKGAALATAAAEAASAVAYLTVLHGRRGMLGDLAPRLLLAPPPSAGPNGTPPPQELLPAGASLLTRTALLLGSKTAAAAAAARLGAAPAAAHHIVLQVWLLDSFLTDALAVAGQTLVASHLGAGGSVGLRSARAVSDRLLQLGVGGSAVLALALAALGPAFPAAFTSDPGVLSGVHAIWGLALALLPLNGAVYVLDGVLAGASDFDFLAQAMVLSALCTVAGLELSGHLEAGLLGVWWALAALMASRLATLSWRYAAPAGPLGAKRGPGAES